MDNIKKRALSAKGIVGIFELLDKFFASNIKKMSENEKAECQDIFRTFESQFEKARQYSKIGRTLAMEISDLLSKSDQLMDSVEVIQQDFKDARQGLRGVSDLSEQAATEIQTASNTIQESIDKLKKDISNFQNIEALSEEEKKSLGQMISDIEGIADVSFNIVMELQFQDIMRQQLSAVASILVKTRARIAEGLEKITGVSIQFEESDEKFAATDSSILNPLGGQDDVEEIIKAAKKR